MRKIIFIGICLWVSLAGFAQDNKKFSPEKFEADQQDFITKEAKLDEREAAKFFPLLKEMQKKQRAIYNRMRGLGMQKPSDEAGCEKAIRERDKCNLELRQVEQNYHKKMLQVISASKLYDAIRAESDFHRKMMQGWRHGGMGRPGGPIGKPMGWRPGGFGGPNGKPTGKRP